MQLALSTAGDVAVLEPEDGVVLEPPAGTWDPALVGQSWTWTSTLPCTPEYVSAPPVPCALGCMVTVTARAPPQAPPAHLRHPPPFVDLTMHGGDNNQR